MLFCNFYFFFLLPPPRVLLLLTTTHGAHPRRRRYSYELSPLVQCPLFAAVATLALALPAHAHGLAWGEEHLVRHVHAVLARRDQDKCKIIVQIACPDLEQAGISIWGIT